LKKFGKVNIEISNICNLQCSFCPEVIRSPKIMNLELFEKIIKQVAPITEQVCFHLMGDPLVHPKLEALLDICHIYKTKVFFVTNGVLLKEKFIQTLLHPCLRQVNFSLHSFIDNYPDKNFEQYLNHIFHYTETAFTLRPDLYLNYRLWNLQETRGNSASNKSMLEHIEKKFSISIDPHFDVRTKKSIHIKNKLYLHFDTEFIWPEMHLPILGTQGTCYGLSSHFGILVDGTVVPCCLDKEGSIPLGNINNELLETILESERSKAILKGFRERKLVEPLCQRCQYIERFS
jgi:radical SAM protein with 4Fe4S-binding SPASM domain